MGFGVKMRMEVGRELENAIVLLDRRAPGVCRRAMALAMRPVKAATVALAPYDTRLLKMAIGSRAYITRSKDAIIGEVLVKNRGTRMVVRKGKKKATRANPYFYAHLMELGVQPHKVGAGSKIWAKRPDKSGRFGKKGPQTGAMHPGVTGRHFMENALRQTESAVQSILEDNINSALSDSF